MKQRVHFIQICIEHGPKNHINFLWALDIEGRIWVRKSIKNSKWVMFQSPTEDKKEESESVTQFLVRGIKSV